MDNACKFRRAAFARYVATHGDLKLREHFTEPIRLCARQHGMTIPEVMRALLVGFYKVHHDDYDGARRSTCLTP